MDRIYRLIVSQEDISSAEIKLEEEGVDHLEFLDFKDDYMDITSKPMFELSDSEFLVVSDESSLGRLVEFMFRGGVKTARIDEVTNDIFYNKIDLTGCDDKFEEATRECLMGLFEQDDVFDKMKELGGAQCLTETDKLIIEKKTR